VIGELEVYLDKRHPASTLVDLETFNAAKTKPRTWRRFRGVLRSAHGVPPYRITDALGRYVRALQNCGMRYNASGGEALAERLGRGRKPKLTSAEHGRLLARIEAGPNHEDGACTFHARDVR
jgi:hypothetical protein